MQAIKNKVQLVGGVKDKPEILNLESGKKVARFSVCTSDSYRNSGEIVTELNWHTIVAHGRMAELSEQHLHKGKEVAIEGRLVTRQYTDKEGVVNRVSEVIATEILFLGGKSI